VYYKGIKIMASRSSIEITFYKKDLDKIQTIFNDNSKCLKETELTFTYWFGDIHGGGFEELEEIEKQKIDCFGQTGGCIEYDPTQFVCFDGDFKDCPCNMEGSPIIDTTETWASISRQIEYINDCHQFLQIICKSFKIDIPIKLSSLNSNKFSKEKALKIYNIIKDSLE